jgi:hypothetical protein
VIRGFSLLRTSVTTPANLHQVCELSRAVARTCATVSDVELEQRPGFTNRQARAVIVAAEALGFEREPDLYARHYDHLLHEDAQRAAAFLEGRDPTALEAALCARDPVPTWVAVDRIMNECGVSLADCEVLIEKAASHGFVTPESDMPLTELMKEFDRARAALTFLWDRDAEAASELLGSAGVIAPLPESAIDRVVRHRYGGPLPDAPDGRELVDEWQASILAS